MGLSGKLFGGSGDERPLCAAPRLVRAIFVLSLSLQALWSGMRPPATASAQALPAAPDAGILQLAGLGEPGALAKALMLWLQAFDNQPGISVPFTALDYARVIDWLDALLDLDDRFQYPLLSASRLYAATPDNNRNRQMLEFVHRRFLEDPNRRWPWMTHAVHVAKHRIQDPQLALRYAGSLRLNLSADAAPPWARQLEIHVLEELGEAESAAIIIRGLLESGKLRGNDRELRFLNNRLAQLQGE